MTTDDIDFINVSKQFVHETPILTEETNTKYAIQMNACIITINFLCSIQVSKC